MTITEMTFSHVNTSHAEIIHFISSNRHFSHCKHIPHMMITVMLKSAHIYLSIVVYVMCDVYLFVSSLYTYVLCMVYSIIMIIIICDDGEKNTKHKKCQMLSNLQCMEINITFLLLFSYSKTKCFSL